MSTCYRWRGLWSQGKQTLSSDFYTSQEECQNAFRSGVVRHLEVGKRVRFFLSDQVMKATPKKDDCTDVFVQRCYTPEAWKSFKKVCYENGIRVH